MARIISLDPNMSGYVGGTGSTDYEITNSEGEYLLVTAATWALDAAKPAKLMIRKASDTSAVTEVAGTEVITIVVPDRHFTDETEILAETLGLDCTSIPKDGIDGFLFEIDGRPAFTTKD